MVTMECLEAVFARRVESARLTSLKHRLRLVYRPFGLQCAKTFSKIQAAWITACEFLRAQERAFSHHDGTVGLR